MSLLRLPDGGEIDLPLEYMLIKDCVFVPCLNTDATRDQVLLLANKLQIKLKIKAAVNEGYLGILVWRVG